MGPMLVKPKWAQRGLAQEDPYVETCCTLHVGPSWAGLPRFRQRGPHVALFAGM